MSCKEGNKQNLIALSRKGDASLSLYKTEGIVLKSYNLKEADRILVIYTKDHGKINCVAKGVRRNQSKLRGFTQFLTYADFVLYPGKSLDTITQCEPKEMFAEIKGDLERWAVANFLVELLLPVIQEKQVQESLFYEFLTALHLVSNLKEPRLGAIFFTVRLLQLSGYQPQLTSCASCYSREIGEKDLYLSGALGGILCEGCRYLDPKALKVQKGEIAIWQRLSNMEAKLISRLKLSPFMEEKLIRALFYYYQYQIEKQLKTPAFLNHLRSFAKDKNPSFKAE